MSLWPLWEGGPAEEVGLQGLEAARLSHELLRLGGPGPSLLTGAGDGGQQVTSSVLLSLEPWLVQCSEESERGSIPRVMLPTGAVTSRAQGRVKQP